MENQISFEHKEKSNDWKWTMKNDYPQEKNGLTVFSCFSCGGSTMGYKLAGCDVIGNCEIDKRMNEVYINNHHPKFNFCMDIREFNKLPNNELPKELFNLDILDGSPPCTTFSMAGEREKSWGKKKKFREGQTEQTLDDLSFVFIDTVAKLKPKFAVMENVEGLLLGNAWTYVQKIYEKFKLSGYYVKHYLCKAENMGVPQKRHRVFFIAARYDMNFDFDNLDMYFNYEPVLYGEIKSGNGTEINKSTQYYKMLCKATPQDHSISDVIERLGGKKRCFNAKIIWENEVCPTVTAKCELYRGKEKSKISTQDIIYAQTFPTDYIFPNNRISTISYICGMSVPPVMTKRIVQRIIKNMR